MTTAQRPISPVMKALLAIDVGPWDIFYRAGIGYSMIPAFLRIQGAPESVLRVTGFLLAVLLAMRIIPGMARRVLPFPAEIQAIWAERRATAKRYDSYQWRKMLGIGVGWCAYLVIAGGPSSVWPLAAACVGAGAAGAFYWRRLGGVAQPSPNQALAGKSHEHS